MLRLPAEGEWVPPLVIPGHRPEPEAPMAEGPPAANEGKGELRRRRKRPGKAKAREEEEIFDETFKGKTEVSAGLVKGLMGSVVLTGLLIAGVLLWPRDQSAIQAVDALPLQPLPAGEVVPEADLAAMESVVSPTFIEETLEPVYRSFLNAISMEEMAKWSRNPERTLARMKDFYRDGYQPPGFAGIVWSGTLVRRGDVVELQVEDGGFSQRTIFAVEEEDGWRIDWESWVGWSEESWDEFRKERPKNPRRFRVKVSGVDYYNFAFSDESRWASYQLVSPDDESSFHGYAERGGEADALLKSYDQEKDRPFVVDLAYPGEGEADNQVRIERVVAEGWLVPEER